MTAAKQEVRQFVWERMTAGKVVGFPGAKGRIPNFTGAGEAARRLAERPEWETATTLKTNPDLAQLPVRAAALAAGKLVFMAVPRLAAAQPFLLLDPDELVTVPARVAATIKGSARHGVPVAIEDLSPIDLVVCGTVAVNRDGARIGKGGGFSDLEFALAAELGLITDRTTIATTVHPLQLVDGELPETDHDFRVDLIVTPEEVIAVDASARRRPPGILWGDLDAQKVASIPVLAARAARR
jgi:5-formyltetrahydrofolate cyclo-ligase